jgi:hypothetical protein
MAQQGHGEPDLIGLAADDSLLGAAPEKLPASLGRPAELSVSPVRGRVVGVGVTLTGLTLVGGIALVILGLIELLVGGGGALVVVALVLGLALVGTHWGWVHVAEATAVGLDRRANAPTLDQRTRWLGAIAPFTRYEITTRSGDDGSITIERIRYEPVHHSERTFTFRADTELTEVHSGEEPGAAISERAELLRRQASLDTERERERFQVQAEAFELAAREATYDRERQEAVAAESRALSEQINANLRDPPLLE